MLKFYYSPMSVALASHIALEEAGAAYEAVRVDFANGDLLQLTGRTEIVMDGAEVASFQGAERLWRVEVTKLVRRRAVLGGGYDGGARRAGTGARGRRRAGIGGGHVTAPGGEVWRGLHMFS